MLLLHAQGETRPLKHSLKFLKQQDTLFITQIFRFFLLLLFWILHDIFFCMHQITFNWAVHCALYLAAVYLFIFLVPS